MRLTSAGRTRLPANRERPRAWTILAVAGGILATFTLDRSTGRAPVQHLYYLPIIVAARAFGQLGGLAAAVASIILYHLANHPLLRIRYEESDIIQVALFVAVALVTAKTASDAKRLHQLAMTDDLTGLHNLRSFEARLADLIRASRQTGTWLSLLVLDVDRLKALNDAYGHLTGAEAVRAVGHLLATRLPSDAVACRYGGDEFVVALPGYAAPRAEEAAEGIRRAIQSSAPVLAGHAWAAGTLSISVGIASRSFLETPDALEADEDASERLFQAADQALYRAKAAGRNRVSS